MNGSGRDGAEDRLPADFFARPALIVAAELLGCRITHAGVTIRLTEVEAYGGLHDPASHAYRGITPRTAVMFGPPGGLYVYFTYGMHYCANLVCEPEGTAAAVLLRAGEVVAGHQLAASRRQGTRRQPPATRDLARGPARLAQALALGRDQNGVLTWQPQAPVRISGPAGTGEPGRSAARPGVVAPQLRTGPRVGVAGPGGDPVAFPWRFWLDGEPSVSLFRAGVPRRRSAGAHGSPGRAGRDEEGHNRG